MSVQRLFGAGHPPALAPAAPRTPSTVWPQVLYWLLVLGLIAVHAGGPVRLVYLAGGLAVGWRLLQTSPAAYVGFVFWLWVLTAFVRRVADLYASWQDPSMILLTPYLVTTLWLGPYIWRVLQGRARSSTRLRNLDLFVLAAMGVAVGVPFGFLADPFMALLETLNYVTPLLLGWYVVTQAHQVREIERQIVTTFRYAALVTGGYGIYQFTTAPPWDALWMINTEMGSIGKPEPFVLRVFSTMHSPGVLAPFLVVAMVLLVAKPRVRDLPVAGLAGVTMLLSQVRAAWMGLVIGAMFVVASLKPAQKLRVGLALGLTVLLAGPLLVTPEMTDVFNTRMETFQDLEGDTSWRARITGLSLALDFITRHPLGVGIGQFDETISRYVSSRDSTIVSSLVQFGVLGSASYFFALWLVAVQVWKYYRRGASAESTALACGGLGLLSLTPLGVPTAGPTGMCFWLITGLAVADRQLARARETRAVVVAPHAPRSPAAQGHPATT
ncbi:MAG: O-antigen ligase family protein [Vicinamibacteraceae bacterium]